MKTKILVPVLIVAGLSLAVASTFAATGSNTSTSGSSTNTLNSHNKGFGMGGHRGGPMGGPMSQITEAEKTALESMTNTEKQAFFEKKRTEMEAKRDAHEAVVDKLLAGTTLTADEEKVRQEIIAHRTEMKAKRAEMEANRTKIQAILEKKKAGTTLTTDEQTLIDSMPKIGGRGGLMKGMMNRLNSSSSTTTAQ